MSDEAGEPVEAAMAIAPEAGAMVPSAERLMISRLVLFNFKSYAGEVTVGPFDKNMTSVVGPNGSGKSNVIDAMLFVFGWKAKKMRQNKLSELIHSSEDHPALKNCRVSVHFQRIRDLPDGGYEIVPGSELVVSREAQRDNSSKYSVDGKTSSFGEVTALLRKQGIDLDHNRFLILQGEVEQIAMMKPKAPSQHEDGLLEYLEDIIGSNKLVAPITEAQAATEQLNEQRASKLQSLKAVEQQKQQLEGRKAEAESYIRTEAALHEKRSAFFQKNAAQCAHIAAEAEAKAEAVRAQLDDEKHKVKVSTDKLGALEKAYKKSKSEYDKGSKQLEESRKEFQAFEREDIKTREELKHLKSTLKKTSAATDKEQKKLGELRHQVATLEEDVPRLETEERELNVAIKSAEDELEKMYDALKGQTEPLRRKMEARQREREPKAQQLAALVAEEQLVSGALKLLREKVEQGAAALSSAETTLAEHVARVAQCTAELDEGTRAQAERERRLEALATEVAALEQEEAALAETQRASRAKYEEGRRAAESTSSRSVQLRALLAAKKSKAIPGFIGRLGSLGTIESEYDVAISTACGALDHMVVSDTAAAEQCLELMRAKQLGVATFIALDKQRHLEERMKRTFDAPKGSQRLFDLVKVADPAHAAAFYFALQDTLVCADHGLATRIAVEGAVRRRVVTTDGVVINASGTMEGGGKPSRGRMDSRAASEAVAPEELEALMAEAEKAAAKLESVRGRQEAAAGELRVLSKERSAQATALKKLRMQLDVSAEHKKALEARVAEARNGGALTAEEETEQRDSEAQLKALAKKVEAQKAVVDRADADLHALQEEVLEVGGIKLRAQKSKVETLGSQLAGVQAQTTKARVDAESRAGAVAKAEKAVQKLQATAAETEAKVGSTKERVKKLEDEAYEVLQAYEKCQQALADKEEALKAMSDEYESFKASVGKVRTVEVELSSQLDDLRRAVKEHGVKQRHWGERLHALREAAVETARLLGDAGGGGGGGEAGGGGGEAGREGEGGEAGGEAGEGEGADASPCRDLSSEELDSLSLDSLNADIGKLESALGSLTPNLSVLGEYAQREAEWRAKLREFESVTLARDDARKSFEELRKQRLNEFMTGFRIIGLRLKEMYQMITLGGDAELELVDSLDPFSEGIVFSVRPPKKSWKNIANLSGGEKTLSSLALVFALHHYKPTPLYVMDEIDAALDFRNVSIVGNYIKERTRDAQFVIISLRNNMFELADRLVGIYKTHNTTKSLAINPCAFTVPVRA